MDEIARLQAMFPLETRLRVWLEAVHRAGGLDFLEADDGVRREIRDLEQSTPMADRDAFRDLVQGILGANCLTMCYYEATWLQAETAVWRGVALMSLALVADRGRGGSAGRGTEGSGASGPGGGCPVARGRKAGRPPSLADAIIALARATVGEDSRAATAYFAEALGGQTPGGRRGAGGSAKPRSGSPERFLRGLPLHLGQAIDELHVPVAMCITMDKLVVSGHLALPNMQWALPPVYDYWERATNLLDTIRDLDLADGIWGDRPLTDYTTVALPYVTAPHTVARAATLIGAYDGWLYPDSEQALIRNLPMGWHAWAHRDRAFLREIQARTLRRQLPRVIAGSWPIPSVGPEPEPG